jgi:hypothetical protein
MKKDEIADGDGNKRFRIPLFEGFKPWGPDPEGIPAVDAGYPAPDIHTDVFEDLSATGVEVSPMFNPLNMAFERYGRGIYPADMKTFVQFELARHMSAACDSDPELSAWVDHHIEQEVGAIAVSRFALAVTKTFHDSFSMARSADDKPNLTSVLDLQLPKEDIALIEERVSQWLADWWQKPGTTYERADDATAAAKELWNAISGDGRAACIRRQLEFSALHFDLTTFDSARTLTKRLSRYSDRDLALLHLVDEHVKTWAGTSMDTDYTSISVQRAVEVVFGLTGHASVYDRINADEIAGVKAQYEKNKPFLHTFVRAVYQNTQDFLASNNVETVYAMRGVKFNTESAHFKAWYVQQPEYDVIEVRVQEEIARQKKESIDAQMADVASNRAGADDDFYSKSDDEIRERAEWDFDEAHRTFSPATQVIRRNFLVDELMRQGEVQQQPVSSWSVDINTADDFGENGLRLGAYIPASRIWSTSFTGLGCLNEQELLVLGGTDEVQITDMRRPRL